MNKKIRYARWQRHYHAYAAVCHGLHTTALKLAADRTTRRTGDYAHSREKISEDVAVVVDRSAAERIRKGDAKE